MTPPRRGDSSLMSGMPLSDDSSFLVQCTGQVESGDFGDVDNLYCRYAFHLGNDWSVLSVSAVPICIPHACTPSSATCLLSVPRFCQLANPAPLPPSLPPSVHVYCHRGWTPACRRLRGRQSTIMKGLSGISLLILHSNLQMCTGGLGWQSVSTVLITLAET